jgi:2-hydroxy-6-oxonona-2,4-dienedioate hydrolase
MTEPEDVAIWPQLMRTAFCQRFVEVAGVRTRVVEAGDGPPLILLHGTGGHAEAYARNIATLSRRFRVIAYDMLGHGFTDRPDRPYTLDDYAGHLEGLMDALEIPRAHISGESLGGWVGAWFACRRPGRVDRLVLTTPGNVTSKPETMRKIRDSTMRAVAEASRETVRSRLEWLFAPQTRHLVSEELVSVRLAIYGLPGAEQAMRNVLVLQEPDVRARYAWSRDWCSQISAPTLIVWTSDDPTGDVDEGRLLADWIPGAQLTVVDGAGHWPQWERPDVFDRLHERFLLTDPEEDAWTTSGPSSA